MTWQETLLTNVDGMPVVRLNGKTAFPSMENLRGKRL